MAKSHARVRVGGWLLAGVLLGAAPPVVGGQAPAPLPPAKDVIARHVKAIGGAGAFKGLTSIRLRGKFTMEAQGITGDMEMVAAPPAKMVLRVEVPGVGHIETGYDGKIGWTIDPLAGPSLLTGRQLSEMADDAWFDGALHGANHVREATTIARTQFDKHAAYQLKIVSTSGAEQTEYFDVDSGLELGLEATRDTPLGVVPTISLMRDYQKFGPLMQPTTLVQRTMGIDQVLTISSCEYNVVPSTAFDVPPQIKALIK